MAEAKAAKEFSTYKGRPLVRCGDEIYYGNMEEPYVVRLQIKSKKEVGGIEVADKITVQLMATDPYLLPRKAIVKTSEKQHWRVKCKSRFDGIHANKKKERFGAPFCVSGFSLT